MYEHRAENGKLMYYMSRGELERLPGYKGNHHKARACCPIHNGDNPTALDINWDTGWAHCWACGDAWSIRIEGADTVLPKGHPDYRPGAKPDSATKSYASRVYKAPARPVEAPQSPDVALRLSEGIERAVQALPGSPGERYLQSRGISLEVAQALHIGWSTSGKLANRVIFPLAGPDGTPVGATGRALGDTMGPKYKALSADDGYRKWLFPGAGIQLAKQTGFPLLIVEGQMDATAAYAAGYPYVTALGTTGYKHWEHFAGVQRAILLLDSDAAGMKARAGVYDALQLEIPQVQVCEPGVVLQGCKDLGEYWQQHRRLPAAITGAAMGPHMLDSTSPICTTPTPTQNGDPMKGGIPHEGPGMSMGTPVIPGGYIPAPMEGKALQRAFLDLDPDLQMEAFDLLNAIQGTMEEPGTPALRDELIADYREHAATLSDADRIAVQWVIWVTEDAATDTTATG